MSRTAARRRALPSPTRAALVLALAAGVCAPAAAAEIPLRGASPTASPTPTSSTTAGMPAGPATPPSTPPATPSASPTGTPRVTASPSGTGTPTPSGTGTPTAGASGAPAPARTATPPAPEPAAPTVPAPSSSAAAPVLPVRAAAVGARLAPTAAAEQQARYAAHFLATRLRANGDHFDYPDTGFGLYPDHGNTIDAVLALDASGTGGAAADAATDWVQGTVGGYVEFGGDTFTGPTGKTLVLAAAQGRDPRAFGGKDLVGSLQGLLAPTGRFGTSANDFGVTINQALAIIGLQRSGAAVPASALTYLAAQQCADGGVRGTLGEPTCVTDPDATAFAAQAFLAAGDAARAGRALDRLTALQRPDGGLSNSSGEGANANTTGVAAQAFALGGRAGAYTRAAGFLLGLQWGCAEPAAVRGAFAFTRATATVTGANVDSAIRATPQATLGLLADSLVTVEAGAMAADTLATPCAAAPTSEPTPTTSTTPTAQPAAVGGPSDPTSVVVVASDDAPGPAALAHTGTEVLPTVLTGLALLLLGAATVAASRHRGHRGRHT